MQPGATPEVDADPDAQLQADLLAPAEAAPQGPARDQAGRIYVVSPIGEVGTVDEAELPTLGEGYKLADHGVVARAMQAEEYGDVGSQVGAGLEGVAQGATLGLYGAATSALAGDEYDRERRLREEYNPGTALVGNVAGAVLPAVLSGGSSSGASAGSIARTAARFMPSALEASLGAKMATALGGKAASWGASRLGQAGVRALATGIEGAADQAIRTVLDDAANGDVDVTAERMLDGAWTGFATGAALDLGLAGMGAVARGGRKVAESIGAGLPASLDDAAGEAAYKAAVGRTDVRSQRLAQRQGGSAEVGKTLLRRQLVQAGDTVDEIAERLPAAREAAGAELGALLDEVGGGTVARSEIADRVDDVLKRYGKPGQQDVAAALRAKLEASGIDAVLRGEGDVGLRELHDLRRSIDARPDLKWGSAGPGGVDLTTEGMRDVRRAIEAGFEEASDRVAKASGVEDFAARLKQAKRDYAHLALAADQAEEGVMRRAANNRLGLNDVLAGVGGAAAMGPAGALGAVASKFARDRFESTAASLLYGLGKRSERPATLLGRLADDAARTQQAITSSADDTVKSIFSPEGRQRLVSAATLGANQVERAMSRAMALQDPNSPESQSFAASVRSIAADDPALAQALAAKVQARAQFLASKAPPPLDPSDPLQRTPGQMDGATARKNQRYVIAALDPKAAMQRLGAGQGTAEDLETLRALTPRLYEQFVKRVSEQVKKSKRPPTFRERQRLAYVTGQPMAGSDTPQSLQWYQSPAMMQLQEPPPSQNPNLAPAQPPRAPSPPARNGNTERYATRTDRVMSGE